VRGECVEGQCVVDELPDADVLDASSDVRPDATSALPTPVVRWPWNGAATGSAHAAGAVVAFPPLAPAFRWDPVAGAIRYEIELTRECAIESHLTCAFMAPDVTASLPETVFRPAADLEVSTKPPVGARYYYRVRACDTTGCSTWSRVRYVDVGRTFSDFDGDGYSDALVGARRQNGAAAGQGAAWVLRGSASGVVEPAVELPSPAAEVDAYFGVDLASLGDVNGDGFADAIVGAHLVDGADVDTGRAYVYYGSPTGLPATPDVVLDLPVSEPMAYFGRAVTGLGDVNADGFADVAVGAYGVAGSSMAEGRVFVYYGSARGVAPTPGATLVATDPQTSEIFGIRVSAGGDIDADGFADLLVSAYNWDLDLAITNNGRFFVFRGTTGGIATMPSTVMRSPEPVVGGQFAYSVAGLGDVNGDTFGDVIVGARAEAVRGRAYVFHGSPSGLAHDPSWMTDAQAADALEYGFVVEAAGDVGGDGLADAVVTARLDDSVTPNLGRAWVYHGTTGGLSTTPTPGLVGEPREQSAQFGFSAASAGDINGDGIADLFVGAVNQDVGQVNEGVGYWYFGAPGGIAPAASQIIDHPTDSEGAQFGGSVARPIP
jgi:hypothetical protein